MKKDSSFAQFTDIIEDNPKCPLISHGNGTSVIVSDPNSKNIPLFYRTHIPLGVFLFEKYLTHTKHSVYARRSEITPIYSYNVTCSRVLSET